jgi:hypothetical protein
MTISLQAIIFFGFSDRNEERSSLSSMECCPNRKKTREDGEYNRRENSINPICANLDVRDFRRGFMPERAKDGRSFDRREKTVILKKMFP